MDSSKLAYFTAIENQGGVIVQGKVVRLVPILVITSFHARFLAYTPVSISPSSPSLPFGDVCQFFK